MLVTESEELCWCRSWKEGERCRFFKRMPPLKPGFVPADQPWFRSGGECEEILPPSGLLQLGRAHVVLVVHGADVPENEVACIGTFKDDAGKLTVYAWFPQSDTFVQGEAALRDMGIKVEDDLHDPAAALEEFKRAAETLCRQFPRVRMVLALDDGNGFVTIEGNIPHIVAAARKARDENEASADKPTC